MLAAFIIVFREVFEAGLVVGVVLAATRGLAGRGLWIGGGVAAGVLGACLIAVFAEAIAGLFEGAGQETLNAAVLMLAVAMLVWHNGWMAKHGREMAQNLKRVGQEVMAGRKSLAALAIVCGIAVLREGGEVVLFLFGIGAGGGTNAASIVSGSALGILAGGVVSGLLYLGLIAIPLHRLFSSLAVLITLLAAGLGAQAARFLEQGGWITAWTAPLWDTSSLLSEGSWTGRIFHTLIGYVAQPSGAELVGYFGVIAVMALITKIVAADAKPARQVVQHKAA